MLLEAIQHPIRFRLLDGTHIRLAPGWPVEVPEPQAEILLSKAPDRVRVAEPLTTMSLSEGFVVEPAKCQHPVYWESLEGRILGPAEVTHMAKETTVAGQPRFWLCVTYCNSLRWVHESLLRSRRAYEAQWRGGRRP